MVKKMVKKETGLTLEIDKTTLDTLGVKKASDLMMIVMDNTLIIKSKKPLTPQTLKKQQAKRAKQTEDLMKKYETVLQKLAKT